MEELHLGIQFDNSLNARMVEPGGIEPATLSLRTKIIEKPLVDNEL